MGGGKFTIIGGELKGVSTSLGEVDLGLGAVWGSKGNITLIGGSVAPSVRDGGGIIGNGSEKIKRLTNRGGGLTT